MYVAVTVSWRVDRSAAVAAVAVPASAGSRMASPVMGGGGGSGGAVMPVLQDLGH